jgi:ABC-type antimicrobial peptide transport system permease subunit
MLSLTVQGVGGVFVAVFLVAYLGGLPTTNVLHSEPVFRWLLLIFGALFLILIFVVAVVSVLSRDKKQISNKF